jgi:hypothetical protein
MRLAGTGFFLWFVGAAAWLAVGVEGCDLNPQPLPPENSGAPETNVGGNGAGSGASSGGAAGFGGEDGGEFALTATDASLPEGGRRDAMPDSEPEAATPTEASSDARAEAATDATADAPAESDTADVRDLGDGG